MAGVAEMEVRGSNGQGSLGENVAALVKGIQVSDIRVGVVAEC